MRFVQVAIASTTYRHPDTGGDETQEVLAALDEHGNVWVNYLGGSGWRQVPTPTTTPVRPPPPKHPLPAPPGARIPKANR